MISCAKCGNTTGFAIEAAQYITAYVTQDTTDVEDDGGVALEIEYTTKGEIEWEATSDCRCMDCGHVAALANFRVFDYTRLVDASVT